MRRKRSREEAYLEQRHHGVPVAARRHNPATAVPSRGQARRRRAQMLQHHHGDAHGSTASPGTPASDESPRTPRNPSCSRVGGERRRPPITDRRGPMGVPLNGKAIATDLVAGDRRRRPG